MVARLFSLGFSALIILLCLLCMVLFIFVNTAIVFNICGWFQIVSGVCLFLGCVIYPSGWNDDKGYIVVWAVNSTSSGDRLSVCLSVYLPVYFSHAYAFNGRKERGNIGRPKNMWFCPINKFHLSKKEFGVWVRHNKTFEVRTNCIGTKVLFFGTSYNRYKMLNRNCLRKQESLFPV